MRPAPPPPGLEKQTARQAAPLSPQRLKQMQSLGAQRVRAPPAGTAGWEGGREGQRMGRGGRHPLRPARRAVVARAGRIANVLNGAMLTMSAPIALRAPVGALAFRNLLLGGWLSAFGGLLLALELRVPLVQRLIRRHFRFVTSSSGRTALMLCAATMALASGPSGALAALATTANAVYSSRLAGHEAEARRRQRSAHPRIDGGRSRPRRRPG